MVLALPLVLFFSYYPVISLGVGESMNFELSVPLIWLVVFDVVGVVALVKERMLGKVMRKWKWWWLAFVMAPVFVSVSLMWSMNLVRGVLTVGVMWLVIFAVMIVVALRERFKTEDFRKKFWWWFLGSALFACGWCVIQCIMDVTGVSREYSLMCLGCTSYSFGFPHPNGFAIEPQFMGNLLLAPALVAAWLYLRKDDCNGAFRARGRSLPSLRGSRRFYLGRNLRRSLKTPLLVVLFFIIVATLFLVFSRGAIYAFIVGMMFMSGWVLVRERKWVGGVLKRVAVMWGLVVVAFLFTLNLQGVMAQVGPTRDTYVDGVAKALNHLSLGIIDVRGGDREKREGMQALEDEGDSAGEDVMVVEKPVENFESEREDSAKQEEAIFDGYVEESTEIRKMLTRNALGVWSQDFKTVMLGVGIGGAGEAMYEAGLTDSPKEIVQNEYVSLLLEVGVVGISLLVLMLVMVVRVIVVSGGNAGMVLSLLVAYGVSLIFFSGFANALQIYLLPVVLLVVG